MSKISKSIVISEFLWLLFFAVVFFKFDYIFLKIKSGTDRIKLHIMVTG